MKKSISPNAMRITVVGLLIAAICAGVIVIVHAGGLATGNVDEMTARLEIKGDDESDFKHSVVTGTQTYLQSTKQGMVQLAIKKDGIKVAGASANLTAQTQEQAAAAMSALVLHLTGRDARPGMQCSDIDERGDGELQCSDIKFEGDRRFFAGVADKIIDWWDAQASLTHTDYVSPRLNLANLGKLQLNVWGVDNEGRQVRSFGILFFDPTDPTKIVGGTIYLPSHNVAAEVVDGTLVQDGFSSAPGDFLLGFTSAPAGGASGGFHRAVLAIDLLADGTIDVRGIATAWASRGGNFTVEGTGNTKFVVPNP